MVFDIALLPKFGLTRNRTSMMQNSCEGKTCSRSLHINCLGVLRNPYSLNYWSSSLTNQPPCHTTTVSQSLLNRLVKVQVLHLSFGF